MCTRGKDSISPRLTDSPHGPQCRAPATHCDAVDFHEQLQEIVLVQNVVADYVGIADLG